MSESREQVAAKLAEELAEHGGIDVLVHGQMEEILARALAACALEARKPLRKALKEAGEVIHNEFCGTRGHHPCCTDVTNALMESVALERAAGEK